MTTTQVIDISQAQKATNDYRFGIAEAQQSEFDAIIADLRDNPPFTDFLVWLDGIDGIEIHETAVVAVGIVDPKKLLAQYVASKAPTMPWIDQVDLVDNTINSAYQARGYTLRTRKANLAKQVIGKVRSDASDHEAKATLSLIRIDLGAGALFNDTVAHAVADHPSPSLSAAYREITSLHTTDGSMIS